ncbi:MAG: DUF72 domain-containing protein [Planctomycetes bacterium]|nr:DUF72 domain-containing protein [Planctomycetota bacterium]
MNPNTEPRTQDPGSGGRLRFAVAGWSYPDWKGIVYPARRPPGFDELAFVARYFDAVEVNNTFYRPPSAKDSASWARRVADSPRFLFTVKLHQRFTHGTGEPWTAADAAAFRAGIEPLAAAGRLGALLLQFPFSFRNTEANRAALARLAGEFGARPLVAELRHASWDAPPVAPFLAANGIAPCRIDAPGREGPPAVAPPPAAVAYVRFHGRNREAWFRKDAGRDERYDYLYAPEELRSWAPVLRAMAGASPLVFVVGNNHFKGKAPANILALKRLLEGGGVEAPAPLIEAYPFLKAWLNP